jgi:hypothetical protein
MMVQPVQMTEHLNLDEPRQKDSGRMAAQCLWSMSMFLWWHVEEETKQKGSNMARIMSMDQVAIPVREPDVIVQRLTWDWNDPSKTVQRTLQELGNRLHEGCWYLNPMFMVSCVEATRGFLSVVRKRQKEWFRVLNRQFGSANWRKQMRAMSNVRDRQMTFSGLLFVQGQDIDPSGQYLLEAANGLRPETDLVVTWRQDALVFLKQQDWDALKEMSRADLQSQLAANPLEPVYVTPGISVMGRRADDAFYAEVRRRSSQWHRTLARCFGTRNKAEAVRHADLATRMLVFTGTLVVNGAIFTPGCWPNHQVSKGVRALDSTTVSPECLSFEIGSSPVAS